MVWSKSDGDSLSRRKAARQAAKGQETLTLNLMDVFPLRTVAAPMRPSQFSEKAPGDHPRSLSGLSLMFRRSAVSVNTNLVRTKVHGKNAIPYLGSVLLVPEFQLGNQPKAGAW